MLVWQEFTPFKLTGNLDLADTYRALAIVLLAFYVCTFVFQLYTVSQSICIVFRRLILVFAPNKYYQFSARSLRAAAKFYFLLGAAAKFYYLLLMLRGRQAHSLSDIIPFSKVP